MELSNHNIIKGSFKADMRESSSPQLYYRRIMPKKLAENGIYHIIISHGLLEHHGRYKSLINHITESLGERAVITVLDHRGFGLSGGRRSFVDRFDDYTDDLNRLLLNEDEFLGTVQMKRVIIGNDLGSLIGLKTISDYGDQIKVDAMILANPLFRLKRYKFLSGLRHIRNDLVKKLRIPLRFRGEDLTSDREAMGSYDSDYLINKFFTVGLMRELSHVSIYLERKMKMGLPVKALALISDESILADFKTGEFPDIEKKIYFGMKHDIFNEVKRDDVFSDIVNLIKST